MDDRELYRLIERAGGKILEVGGCVRDALRGVPPKDRDYLVCKLAPEAIIKLLRPHGRVDVVGQSFGVLKFTPRGETRQIDLSLPRREVSTGVGHRDFHVDADPDLPVEVDLGRRDFTINAIARDCLTGALIDPFDGAADLAAKRLRMVAPRAFEEDPLRVLRGAQFAARLELAVEPATLAAMRAAAHLLPSVSPERVAAELVKGLKAARPAAMFRLLHENGLLAPVLPELAALGEDAFAHSVATCDLVPYPEADRVPLRLAAVFHRLAHGACEELLERGRFTSTGENVDVARIVHLVREQPFACPHDADERALRHFASRVGPHAAEDVTRLRIGARRASNSDDAPAWDRFLARLTALLERRPPLTTRDLAVNGRDLIAAGVKPGPQMGQLLHRLLQAVLDEPARNTRDELLALALAP